MATATKKASETESGISRIDQPAKRSHGWFARLYHDGKTLSRFFSDKQLGSKKAAQDAAQEHLQRIRSVSEGTIDLKLENVYITRMKYTRVCGWCVRVPKGDGTATSRLFSDAVYGGTVDALKSARIWRNVLVTHYGFEERAAFVLAADQAAKTAKAAKAKAAAKKTGTAKKTGAAKKTEPVAVKKKPAKKG